jgi:hypothetical protein
MREVMSNNIHQNPSFVQFVERHRWIFLSSPVWGAAILVLLRHLGGPELRTTIDFIVGQTH